MLTLLAGGVALTACSSGASTIGDVFDVDAAVRDGAVADVATVPDGSLKSPVCPSSPPAAGAKCTGGGVACEYGSDPDPSCNPLFTCTSAALWEARSASTVTCPTPPASADARCPATYSSGRAGSSCDDLGLACAYPEGRCACARVPLSSDAGDAGTATRWTCDAPQNACPTPRPRLGAACARAGQICNYGACVLRGGQQIVCLEGYWQLSRFDCQAPQ